MFIFSSFQFDFSDRDIQNRIAGSYGTNADSLQSTVGTNRFLLLINFMILWQKRYIFKDQFVFSMLGFSILQAVALPSLVVKPAAAKLPVSVLDHGGVIAPANLPQNVRIYFSFFKSRAFHPRK